MKSKDIKLLQSSFTVPLRTLIQRIGLVSADKQMRTITFISARPREGTSTIARDYAMALAAQTDQKVLLIDAGALSAERFRNYGVDPSMGIIDAMMTGAAQSQVIYPIGQNVSVARWVGRDENRGQAEKVIHTPDFWQALLKSFDVLVIDAPSLQTSFDGVVLAAKGDAAVLVVEAETTPQPVVRHLRDTLTETGAKVAGVVLNKRRYYIPEKVYRKL